MATTGARTPEGSSPEADHALGGQGRSPLKLIGFVVRHPKEIGKLVNFGEFVLPLVQVTLAGIPALL